MMNVYSRREEILKVIRESSVHSQEELLALLKKRGFTITQPTLSRDMKELGLAKTPSGYVAPGDLATVTPITTFVPRERREERLHQLIRDSVMSAEAAGNLVVLKTPPAAAQPVASALDAADLEGVVGTIGGDDTIFVALSTADAAARLTRHIHEIAGIGPRRRTRA
jgi:transcriptional regulator of arginine metabolism